MNIRTTIIAIFFFLMTIAISAPRLAAGNSDATDRDWKRLQGKWIVTSVITKGDIEVNQDGAGEVFEFTDRKVKLGKRDNREEGWSLARRFVAHRGEKEYDKAGYRVNSTQSPKLIDLIVFGVPGAGYFKGATINGLFRFRDNFLEICLRPPNKNQGRPEEFGEEDTFIIRFKRIGADD